MRRAMLLAISALAATPVAAGTIYKSVDRDGNVTYAAQPLPSAVKVEPLVPAEPPSEEQVRQAQEQADAIEALNQRREKERKDRAKEEAERRAAAGQTIIVERPYMVPIPSEGWWWGVPPLPPERPIRPPGPRPTPPPPPTPRPRGGVVRR